MKNFYIGIDCIFDLRLSVIHRMDESIADTLLNGNYRRRKCDIFEGIDKREYDRLIQSYDKSILENSYITNVFEFLKDNIVETMRHAIMVVKNQRELPKLMINIWPYELTQDEMKELRVLSYTKLGGIIGVDVISKEIRELTPQYLDDNYYMCVMYYFNQWLNVHNDALAKKPYPLLTIIGPMVYLNTDPDKDEEAKEFLSKGLNGLAIVEAMYASTMRLKLVFIDVFSIEYPEENMMMNLQDSEEEFQGKNLETFMKELDEIRKKEEANEDKTRTDSSIQS